MATAALPGRWRGQIKLADVELRMRRIDCNRRPPERPIENFANRA